MHPTILDLTQYQHGIGSEARLEKATHHTDEDRLVMENHEGDADLRGSVSKDSKDSQKKIWIEHDPNPNIWPVVWGK